MQRQILVAGMAAAVVGLVAVLAATAGPVRTGEPVLPLERLGGFFQQIDIEEPIGDSDRAEEARRQELPVSLVLLAAAAVLFAVAAIIYLFAPVFVGQRFRWRRSPPAVEPPPVDLVEQLRRTAERAADDLTLRPSGRVTDDVIRCWVQLEHVADVAGTPRRPAQTPSEFTAALLRGHHADHAAVGALLTRYHRARFGSAPLPAEDAEVAVTALWRIAATLTTAVPAAAGPASGDPR